MNQPPSKGSQKPKAATESKPSAQRARESFLRSHSLGIACCVILLVWVVMYCVSNPSTHVGSFFGNAIADWTGVVVTVLATKYFYEKGSAESRHPTLGPWGHLHKRLMDHSLSLFLLVTGIAWVVAFVYMDPQSKWGQVIGNIVSEWTQLFGLVLLTKRLIERHSKESSGRSQ
jgi:hypothetical protein